MIFDLTLLKRNSYMCCCMTMTSNNRTDDYDDEDARCRVRNKILYL